MTEKVKVVIAGAGPAGSACASALAMLGIEPVVLVDKAKFPRKKTCAGGLGPGAEESLKELGLWKTVYDRSNRVTAMKAVTPSGKELFVSGSATALIMPRENFDAILLRRAGDLGARVVTGEKVRSIMWKHRSPCGVVTETGRRIEAIWTVIAAGGGTGLLPRKRKHAFGRTMKGLLTRYEDFEVDSNTVEFYFDRDLKPAYGWVFPEGKKAANVGVFYNWDKFPGKKPKDVYRMFANRYLEGRINRAKRVSPLSGCPIFTAFAPAGIARPGLLVAGEAGWLVNPATGEGINQALRSGMCAAQVAADHLKGKLGAAEAAALYERKIKAGLSPGLMLGEVFRLVGPTVLELACYLPFGSIPAKMLSA